jgi:hypothetical protein
MDVSVTMMMKNAVKCDNNCDMQPLVNHHIFERQQDLQQQLNAFVQQVKEHRHNKIDSKHSKSLSSSSISRDVSLYATAMRGPTDAGAVYAQRV